MAIVEKNSGIIDERLHSEDFRKKLLTSPVLIRKQKEGKEIAKALSKSVKK